MMFYFTLLCTTLFIIAQKYLTQSAFPSIFTCSQSIHHRMNAFADFVISTFACTFHPPSFYFTYPKAAACPTNRSFIE